MPVHIFTDQSHTVNNFAFLNFLQITVSESRMGDQSSSPDCVVSQSFIKVVVTPFYCSHGLQGRITTGL